MLDTLALFNLAAINSCTLVSHWLNLQLDYRQKFELSWKLTLLSSLQLILLYLPLLVLAGGFLRFTFLSLKMKCRTSPVDELLLNYSPDHNTASEEERSLKNYSLNDGYNSYDSISNTY